MLVAGVLAGCSVLSPFKSCDGSEDRLRELESLKILDAGPPEAATPEDLRDIESGCLDDSGDAWLYAARTYSFPGTRQEVLQYYRAAASKDGWKLEEDPYSSVPDEVAGLCFTKGGDGASRMLTIYFQTAQDLKIDGYRAGPEFASGSGYRIEAMSEVDGLSTSCYE